MKINIESDGTVQRTKIRDAETGQRVGFIQKMELTADVKIGWKGKITRMKTKKDEKTGLSVLIGIEDIDVEIGNLSLKNVETEGKETA